MLGIDNKHSGSMEKSMERLLMRTSSIQREREELISPLTPSRMSTREVNKRESSHSVAISQQNSDHTTSHSELPGMKRGYTLTSID